MTGEPSPRWRLDALLHSCDQPGQHRYNVLASSSRDEHDRSSEALSRTMAHTLLWMVLGLFVVFVAGKVTQDKDVALALYGMAVVGGGLRAYLATVFEKGSVWETMTWLDLEERTFNSCIRYPDGALPDRHTRLPFADLGILWYGTAYLDEQRGGHYHGYIVSLCLREEAERFRPSRLPANISELMRSDSAQQSRDFAINAARRYGIAPWEVGDCESPDGPARLIRLC